MTPENHSAQPLNQFFYSFVRLLWELVRIVLLRHGEPRIDKDLQLSARDFGHWVSRYNAAGIDDRCMPYQSAIEQAATCQFVVCSNLPRSLESANALGVKAVGLGEVMFREMEMPYASWSFPQLSLVTWSILFRLMWVIGYRANAESFADAKERARACAERLIELASTYQSVLHVGHGTMNWSIAKHLKSMGWAGPPKAPRKYWEFGVYSNLAGAGAGPCSS